MIHPLMPIRVADEVSTLHNPSGLGDLEQLQTRLLYHTIMITPDAPLIRLHRRLNRMSSGTRPEDPPRRAFWSSGLVAISDNSSWVLFPKTSNSAFRAI